MCPTPPFVRRGWAACTQDPISDLTAWSTINGRLTVFNVLSSDVGSRILEERGLTRALEWPCLPNRGQPGIPEFKR